MNNLDWDDLRFFLAAARHGSLSAAGRALGSNQPTVGRRIAALEQALGFPLFQRHSQGLTLTEDGLRILETVDAMDVLAAGMSRTGRQREQTLSGTVRIAAPEGLAVLVIAPALREFLRLHPLLNVTLEPSALAADLVRGEADVAIRLFRPTTGDLVVRRVCEMGFGFYAAEEYLSRFGVPTSIKELKKHCFITYGDNLQAQEDHRWLLTHVPEGRWGLRSDSTLTRLASAESGIGIAVLPHCLAGTSRMLRRVLPDIEGPARTVWTVVHRDLRYVPRVREVIDLLTRVMERACK